MRTLGSILLASLSVLTLASAPVLAAGDAVCKTRCISQKSEAVAKHKCCPMARLKMPASQKMAAACGDCYERAGLPKERAQLQSHPVEPVSVSERELPALPKPSLPLSSIRLSFHSFEPYSIPIKLHRILV